MIEFELGYLLTSLVAGVLTVLAPCVLPLLPVIIGGSTTGKSIRKPLTIILSLSVSVIVFTLLLKASTVLIGIPDSFWMWLSGGILLIFGLFTLFPEIWEKLSELLGLGKGSNKLLGKGLTRGDLAGDIMIGAALGPVFSSCSPTYGAIVATVLPQNYATGLVYLLVYVVGLAIPLVALAIFGQKLSSRLSILSNPKGWFKQTIAVIFIVLGVFIITGTDKEIKTWMIERGLYDGLVEIENSVSN